MTKMALGALALATVAGLVWANTEAWGLQAAWPLVIGFAIAPLAVRRGVLRATAIGAGIGVAVAWLMYAVVTQYMPFVPLTFGLAAGAAVAILGIAGALLRSSASMPAMFIGFGVFVGLYEPTWIVQRAQFLTDGTLAAATVLAALFGGMLASVATGWLVGVTEPVAAGVRVVVEKRAGADRRAGPVDRRVAALSDYRGPERRSPIPDRRWHLDRRIAAGARVAMAGGGA